MVIPAMVRVPAVLFASAQVPPELARVIVTTSLVVEAVAEQCEKPLGRVIVGKVGSLKAVLKPTTIMLPAASFPLEEVVKPTVQVEVEFAVCGLPVKVTEVTEVAVMVTPDVGLTAVTS